MTDAEKAWYAELGEHGGPAFPSDTHHFTYMGMTLRDYFAAKALQGLLGIPDEWRAYLRRDGDGSTWKKEAAKAAYELADAMLAERAK